MPCPFLIFSQSDYLIRIVAINSHTWWQTVQIQISWLLQKPTDLDLHCLQRQGISRFSRTRVKQQQQKYIIKYTSYYIAIMDGRVVLRVFALAADGGRRHVSISSASVLSFIFHSFCPISPFPLIYYSVHFLPLSGNTITHEGGWESGFQESNHI